MPRSPRRLSLPPSYGAGRPVPSLSSCRSSHVLSSTGHQLTYTVAYAFGRKPLYPMLVVKQVHLQRGEQRRSKVLEVECAIHVSFVDSGPQEPEDGGAAPVVSGVRDALQSV